MKAIVYSVEFNGESFPDTKGLIVRRISHDDPAKIDFTLPEEEGKRFQTLYASLNEGDTPQITLTAASASADLTQTPPPMADIRSYELKVGNIDIDTAEGLYVFTCSGRLKR